MEYNVMTTFAALSDPVRRDILTLLQRGESSAGSLVETLALPQPNIYSLDPAPLAELDSWLAPFRTFWADKLDALGDHLSRSD
jgi:hypothetical protein